MSKPFLYGATLGASAVAMSGVSFGVWALERGNLTPAGLVILCVALALIVGSLVVAAARA